jgi:hypothetical protein
VLRCAHFPDRPHGITAGERHADNAFVALRLDHDDLAARTILSSRRPDNEIFGPHPKRQRRAGDETAATVDAAGHDPGREWQAEESRHHCQGTLVDVTVGRRLDGCGEKIHRRGADKASDEAVDGMTVELA